MCCSVAILLAKNVSRCLSLCRPIDNQMTYSMLVQFDGTCRSHRNTYHSSHARGPACAKRERETARWVHNVPVRHATHTSHTSHTHADMYVNIICRAVFNIWLVSNSNSSKQIADCSPSGIISADFAVTSHPAHIHPKCTCRK